MSPLLRRYLYVAARRRSVHRFPMPETAMTGQPLDIAQSIPAVRRSPEGPEGPQCSAIRPIVKLANSWQIGFLRDIPRNGKSENSRVFIGDLNGGPGWT